MSEETKQKQIAIGNTPNEPVSTYWFDEDSLAILKEEKLGVFTLRLHVGKKLSYFGWGNYE